MKKILFLILFIILLQPLCFAYPMPNPFPPFRIFGNLYYVGTDDLASYLIVTKKGNILINSNLEENVPMIKESIEKLGFKYGDTKILLISHAHLDHAAGSQLIKQQTNTKYMVMDADAPLVESGGKSDFHYAHDTSMYFPKSKVDKILHDGDQIKLGETVLTAHLTGGHTPGCTTWTMQIIDNGKKYNVVFLGSLSVNPGYKLVNNKSYPNIANDYEHAILVLKSLPCDIFLGAHAVYFDLKTKYSLLKNNINNSFIDPIGYKNYITLKEEEFYKELKKQQQEKVITIVKQAENDIKTSGIKKAILDYKNSKDIFIGNFEGLFFVSPLHPELIGKNQFELKDSTGTLVIQEEIDKAKSGGGWLKARLRKNNLTGKYQCRKIYILPVSGNYFIGSWYHYDMNKQGLCLI